jgi:DNA invertase Pin-like site-specific DNA recombinase
MAGQIVGYQRVSTADQRTDRQLDGIAVDRMFTDHFSGATRNRPALEDLRRYVRDGDTVMVHSMDRLARNLDDLRALVREFTEAGVAVEFVKEHMTFNGADSPMQQLMLSLLGAVAEFERALIRERQREGIELAKKRGVYKGRRPSLTAEQVSELRAQAAAGVPKTELARQYGIHRDTVYRYLAAGEGGN